MQQSKTHKAPSDIFYKRINNSQEGKTQSNPIALAMYGLAIFSVIDMFEDQNLTHNWYAHDGTVAGSFEARRIVLDRLNEHGRVFDYKMIQCHLITKRFCSESKQKFFRMRC